MKAKTKMIIEDLYALLNLVHEILGVGLGASPNVCVTLHLIFFVDISHCNQYFDDFLFFLFSSQPITMADIRFFVDILVKFFDISNRVSN